MLKTNNDPFYNNFEKKSFNDIKILTWNFSYAYGVGSAGINYYQKKKSFFINALDRAVELIRKYDPDIVLLQEVDFKSKKTHYIDQLKYLSDKLTYNYAYGNSWDVAYVPFPYFQFKDHFGKTVSGSGILSKYKILSNKTFLFPKPKEVSRFANFFYPYRYLQAISIETAKGIKNIGNVHLEAFKYQTRCLQAHLLIKLLEENKIDFVGGDFNSPPYYAENRSDFPEHKKGSFPLKDAHFIMSHLENYQEMLSKEEYLKDEKRYFSFPSNNLDRRLDYIYYLNRYNCLETTMIESSISDHFPVLGVFN